MAYTRNLGSFYTPRTAVREKLDMRRHGGHAAVLFSGGIDSLACLLWAIPQFDSITAVRFELGHRYMSREARATEDLASLLSSIASFQTNTGLSLGNWESTNGGAFIPLRNVEMILRLAFNYKHVVIGSTLSDSVGDAQPGFFHGVQNVLDRSLCQKSIWEDPQRVKIHTPLINSTKREVVHWIRNSWGQFGDELLKTTTSCYASTLYENTTGCGGCMACFHRWVALAGTGLEDRYHPQSHPGRWMLHKFVASSNQIDFETVLYVCRKWRFLRDVHRAFESEGLHIVDEWRRARKPYNSHKGAL